MKEESNFPGIFTIDGDGIDSLVYFLNKEFKGKTVIISVEIERNS